MEKKLTWEEIKKLYDKEWVELIDYDWPDGDIDPKAGVVRVHAKNRREFDKLALQNPPEHSACVFVGKPDRPANHYLSTFNTVTLKSSQSGA